jgi:hypothetical protein
VEVEIYLILHNVIRYAFGYLDKADRFDSPESKEIRDRILYPLNLEYKNATVGKKDLITKP